MTIAQIASILLLLLVPGSLLPALSRVSPIARSRTRLVLLLSAFALYGVVALWLVLRFPIVAFILASLFGVTGALAVWRGRSRYGERSGLPPGSLGLHSSLAALGDYNFYKKQADRHGPVFKTNQYLRPVACIVGLERGRSFLRDNREGLRPAPLPINRYVSGGLIRYMPPERHGRYRKLLLACMSPDVLAPNLPFATARLRAALGSMASASRGDARPPGVRPAPYLDDALLAVFLKVFFGLEADREQRAEIREIYALVDHRRRFRSRGATRDGFRRLRELIGDRARSGLASEPSFLASAVRHDPSAASDPILLDNLAFLFHTTRCDMIGLLVWHLKFLCDHPEWLPRIRSEIASSADGSASEAARRFVLETLRLRQSEFIYRVAGERLSVDGFEIPRGWLVRVCVRESHTDETVFESPRRFDPDRFLARAWSQQEYAPFGAHDHACIGAHMARTISRMLIEEAAAGFALERVDDGPMELGWSHHGHWRPSQRFRVGVRPR